MNTKQKETLETLAKDSDIKSVVAKDALDNGDEAITYLTNVCNHGGVSGSIRGLVYYADTHAFYNAHADECDEVLESIEDNTGEGFKFNGQDVRNTLAWLAYEEKAREVLSMLDIEL